jgi:hypothetical protein
MEDLEEAIRKAQQAVEVTPQGHPDLADRLSNQARHFSPVFIINLRCVGGEIFVFYRAQFGLLGRPYRTEAHFGYGALSLNVRALRATC